MFRRIKKWWYGEYIEPPIPESTDQYIFLMGYYEKHWTSRFAHKLVKFYLEHWKFIWGSLVAIFCASLKFF